MAKPMFFYPGVYDNGAGPQLRTSTDAHMNAQDLGHHCCFP